MPFLTKVKKNFEDNFLLYKVYQKLLNFLKKIKRILSFPLHLGENDAYPTIETINNKKIKFFKRDSQRIDFWTRTCKSHPTLKHFYKKKPEKSFINDQAINQNSLYFSSIVDFYRDGVGKIENFFNDR